MARHYIQDIMPAGDEPEEVRGRRKTPERKPEPEPEPEPVPRSIRDIRPSAERSRLVRPPEPRMEHPLPHVPQKRSRARYGIWAAAIAALVVVLGAGLLFAFASTSITVIPYSQTVTFDASTPFTAYPEASAAPGTIPYTVMTQVFEDSAVVQASGTENVEEQATGNIVIYNDYSEEPVRLIKNTRFQTPEGLIFRIPASVDVPGKTAEGPGSIEVTVFADQAGPDYNVGPFERITVPGLRSTKEMYENVYAKSTTAFSGGFSGARPVVPEAILDASKAEVRNRLNEKAQEFVRTASETAFAGLMVVNYETLPPTQESGGNVRINERATVYLPVFPTSALAQSIGQTVSASAEGQSISIRFASDVTAEPAQAFSSADLGQQPIVFTISGRGQLVWDVDSAALAEALAGREEAAFQTIIGSFPSIEEARARIVPFWKNTFPEDPSDISIAVEEPSTPF
ncbi:MAG TPA: hypothetical protein VNM40_01330 [Candidatus Paceibacterota bacterium]|nr:hypothetical protein [Candidatus Paceibacterota bacterium]